MTRGQLADIARAPTAPIAILVGVLAGLLFGSPATRADAGCGCVDYPVTVSGDFAHRKDKTSLRIADAAENEAAFREEISGRKFDVVIANLPSGKYAITIGAAETLLHERGERLFDVASGDVALAKDFDIVAAAGGTLKACFITASVEHDEDSVHGPLTITFSAKKNTAKFNSIEVKDDSGDTVVSVNAADVAQPLLPMADNVPQTAAATTPAPSPAKSQGAIRIRAGSAKPFTDSAGNVWKAEEGFEGGSAIDRDPALAVANTKDPGLYRSERSSMDSFSISVPNGKYAVALHFAETSGGIRGEGQRVFSFNVQGHEYKDFDVWRKAGGANRAYIETVPVEVTDGKFKITFTSIAGKPQINAIELVPRSGPAPTPTPAPRKDSR